MALPCATFCILGKDDAKVNSIGIMNGKIFSDGIIQEKNLYIKDGKISAITKEVFPCEKVIDAKGKCLLPGFIDPHVHFSLTVGMNTSSDDFYSGSLEGALGGVTTYIDFLDPVKKAMELAGEFEKRNTLARHSMTDYAFHTTVANPVDSPEDIIKESKRLGINSIKLFTTYSNTDRRTYDDYIYSLLIESGKSDVVIVVHAENDDLISKKKFIPIKEHEMSRPVMTEKIEVMKLAEMARQAQGRLYLVHVSAGSSVEFLASNYRKELENHTITVESCPHYFMFNTDFLMKADGYRYTMTPPVREEVERERLYKSMEYIHTIGTDHCPFESSLKNREYTCDIPMGIGGIRYSFLNMYQFYGFSILDRFTANPAKIYGLYGKKGTLQPGADGDVIIFDENGSTEVKDVNSVYDKKVYRGAIERVFLRGESLVEDGKVLENKGQYISRGKNT